MKLTNEKRGIPGRLDHCNYLNRFLVGDTVYAGMDTEDCGICSPGEAGTVVEKIDESCYLIQWANGASEEWEDFDDWIIPDPKPTITRDELIESYEI